MTWLPAFLLTLAIEVPVALMFVRVPGRTRARVAVVVALASLVSHPLLCFVLLRCLPGAFVARVLVGEAVVIAIEAIVIHIGLPPMRWAHAIAASATINAASYLVGIAFFNG